MGLEKYYPTLYCNTQAVPTGSLTIRRSLASEDATLDSPIPSSEISSARRIHLHNSKYQMDIEDFIDVYIAGLKTRMAEARVLVQIPASNTRSSRR